MPAEALFLYTLAFKFPKDPLTFYFSLSDRKDVNLTKLNHQLFQLHIKEIFPDIKNSDTIYTSFRKKIDGFQPLQIYFAEDNFALVKRYYNRQIKHYFTPVQADSIKDAIIQYKNSIQNPDRLIIHYYKDMRQDEVEIIEDTLSNLNLDIPVFIVTINKTESEDIIVFDDDFAEKMPYSGRYINLVNNTFLLCNTRYEIDNPQRIESFPFPVKLKIKCPTDPTLLNQNTIKRLIDQVYQFSRIYWKSVKQQNLPVTIKYPEMVASIAPYFSNGSIPATIGKDNLWFL